MMSRGVGSGGSATGLALLAAVLGAACGRAGTSTVVPPPAPPGCAPGDANCVCTPQSTGTATCVVGTCPFDQQCGNLCCPSGNLCDQNTCVSTTNACIYVPTPGQFEPPVREWWWPYTDGSGSTRRAIELPSFVQVESTAGVARARGPAYPDDVPTVYFNSFEDGASPMVEGVLRAIRGDDGSPVWTVTDPALRTNGMSSVAVGDLLGDGNVEIVTGGFDPTPGGVNGGVIAFRNNGKVLWQVPNLYTGWGGPAIADMDGDGKPEVIVGNTVLDGATGAEICDGGYTATGDNGEGPLSIAEDIDGDGTLELVTGDMAYKLAKDATGTTTCERIWPQNLSVKHGPLLLDGFAAVAEIIDDPALPGTVGKPETVVVSHGTVRLHDYTGELVLGPVPLPGGGYGGPPTIADFAGDGEAEIGVAGLSRYTVFKPGLPGSVLWSVQTQDVSSSVTGSSVFDFDGDGRPEVVYDDECYIHVFDGPTGRVDFRVMNSSCTAYEMPVVAAVDGTGAANLLVPSNNVCNITCPWGNHLVNGLVGLSLFHSPSDSWVASRPVWNEHSYHLTNVDDFAGIPAQEPRSWGPGTLNSFRQNYQGTGTFDAPDLTVLSAWLDGTQCPTSLNMVAQVANIGARAVAAGVKVAFYEETSLGRNLLGVAAVNQIMRPGDTAVVSFAWVGPPRVTPTQVLIDVDDDGTGAQQHNECKMSNNTFELTDVVCRNVG